MKQTLVRPLYALTPSSMARSMSSIKLSVAPRIMIVAIGAFSLSAKYEHQTIRHCLSTKPKQYQLQKLPSTSVSPYKYQGLIFPKYLSNSLPGRYTQLRGSI